MLNILRNKKFAKKIWIILAVVIIPAFMFWGSQSLIQSFSSRNYAGWAFGKKIPLREFRQAYLATRSQLILQMGEEFLNQEKQINLEPLIWERIILVQEAKRRRIKVDDKEVTEFIKRHPLFLSNQKFDFSRYKYLMESVFRLPPRLFEEKIKENLMLSKLYEQITSEIKFIPEQIKDIYRKDNEEICVAFLCADPEDFKNKITLDENEIKDYFIKNAQDFKRPTTFNLQYLNIVTSAKNQRTEINQQQKIKRIYRQLKRGKSLEEIAKEYGLEVQETNFFSLKEPIQPIPEIGWSAQIINALKNLKTGEFMAPVRTSHAWYILRLKEKKEFYIPSFQEIKEKAGKKLLKLESKQLAKKTLEEALLKIKETGSKEVNFKQTAKHFRGLEADTTPFFRRLTYIPEIGSSDNFFSAIEDLEDGAISKIIEMQERFFVIKLGKRIPIDEEKYQKEKENFKQELIFKEKQRRFLEFLIDLKKRANLKPI